MHFWIDKRATAYHYGRRRPSPSSRGGPSTFGGRDRHVRTQRSAPSSSTTPTPLTSRRGTIDLTAATQRPYQYQYTTYNSPIQSRSPMLNVTSRRQSTASYRPIPDPDIRQALEELDAELRISFPPPHFTPGRSKCFHSKQIGLCLCFMGFILLCTVAGKFIVEGPGIIDASRRPPHPVTSTNIDQSKPSVSFFFASEVLFVAFALGLFFAGVTCLRKRTNAYLLRQFRQHIISSNHVEGGRQSGSGRSSGITVLSTSEDDVAGTSLELEPGTLALFAADIVSRRERRASRYLLETEVTLGQPERTRRYNYNYSYGCQQLLQSMQRPPPYEVALYLPRPNQQVPHHTQATMFSHETRANEDIEKCECGSGSETVSPCRTETPPPSYELQFSCDI